MVRGRPSWHMCPAATGSLLPRPCAEVLETGGIYPHRTHPVRVGVHIDGERKLDLVCGRHEDVGLPHPLDDGAAVGVRHVDGQPHHAVRGSYPLQRRVVLAGAERLDPCGVLLEARSAGNRAVPRRRAEARRRPRARSRSGSSLWCRGGWGEAALAKEGPPVLLVGEIPAQLLGHCRETHIGPDVLVIEHAADRGERAALERLPGPRPPGARIVQHSVDAFDREHVRREPLGDARAEHYVRFLANTEQVVAQQQRVLLLVARTELQERFAGVPNVEGAAVKSGVVEEGHLRDEAQQLACRTAQVVGRVLRSDEAADEGALAVGAWRKGAHVAVVLAGRLDPALGELLHLGVALRQPLALLLLGRREQRVDGDEEPERRGGHQRLRARLAVLLVPEQHRRHGREREGALELAIAVERGEGQAEAAQPAALLARRHLRRVALVPLGACNTIVQAEGDLVVQVHDALLGPIASRRLHPQLEDGVPDRVGPSLDVGHKRLALEAHLHEEARLGPARCCAAARGRTHRQVHPRLDDHLDLACRLVGAGDRTARSPVRQQLAPRLEQPKQGVAVQLGRLHLEQWLAHVVVGVHHVLLRRLGRLVPRAHLLNPRLDFSRLLLGHSVLVVLIDGGVEVGRRPEQLTHHAWDLRVLGGHRLLPIGQLGPSARLLAPHREERVPV
eukprot:scaffold17559_cov110-Isochrysis_galbana.AAC.1